MAMTNYTPEQLEVAARLVYEHYTGKCWHGGIITLHTLDIPIIGHIGRKWYWCPSCGQCLPREEWSNSPPLTTSLDAWRPIWERMDSDVWEIYDPKVKQILERECIWTSFTYNPLHHLEAALKASGLWDKFINEIGG